MRNSKIKKLKKEFVAAREAELLALAKRNHGTVTPEAVVKYAENEKTALHGAFEWDDSVAGPLYRLEQARSLIRHSFVFLELPEEPGRQITIRRYTHVDDGYAETLTLFKDPEDRNYVLAQAQAEFAAFKRKYAHLKELAALFEAGAKIFEG